MPSTTVALACWIAITVGALPLQAMFPVEAPHETTTSVVWAIVPEAGAVNGDTISEALARLTSTGEARNGPLMIAATITPSSALAVQVAVMLVRVPAAVI